MDSEFEDDGVDRSYMEETVQTQDQRYAGKLVGRIKRRPGIGAKEARDLATKYDWYSPDLKYDGRCKRWHVFRERC